MCALVHLNPFVIRKIIFEKFLKKNVFELGRIVFEKSACIREDPKILCYTVSKNAS